ncbi:MAG: glycerol-3-phosphate dehydrogenase/oxidase [Chloroflexota bacterium]|nr:glycerol-3-phosphate dehydrogenase/oxidase [Chloroflexota bacterium]
MKRDLESLAGRRFDVIVVGGGIIGAGIARDAAMRGLDTLLLEKEDFGYGATSRSSRLIHGGLRYLRRLELSLVRQDLHERETLLRIAPHLVRPLPFLIPVKGGALWQRATLGPGLALYDILSYDKSLPSHRYLSREETLEIEPGLELKDLAGAFLYYDCQAPFPERLCLENVLSAVRHGASAANHARAIGMVRDGGDVAGVHVQDELSGQTYQVGARIVVNAAGHWVDSLWQGLTGGRRPSVRRTKGVHLLTSQLSHNAIVLFARADGRLFFVLPWEGHSLIGTTDTDYSGDLDAIHADTADVEYLMSEARYAFPDVRLEAVHYAMAGLRPLADSGARRTGDLSRAHRLVDHQRADGIGGVISVVGGKITAYRAVAQEAVALACRKLGHKVRCTTADSPLPGAPAVSREDAERIASESGLSVETTTHLADLYGSRATEVADLVKQDARGGQPLCPHGRDVLAQVWHAVAEEGARTVSDFLLRRSALGLQPCQGLDAAETVAGEMGRLLGWSAEESLMAGVDAYSAQAALCQRFRQTLPATDSLLLPQS